MNPHHTIVKKGVPIAEVEFPPPVGTEIRIVYGNHNDRLYHVRGIVDDNIVVRHWQHSRKRWVYEVFAAWWWWSNSRATSDYYWVVVPKDKK